MHASMVRLLLVANTKIVIYTDACMAKIKKGGLANASKSFHRRMGHACYHYIRPFTFLDLRTLVHYSVCDCCFQPCVYMSDDQRGLY